MRSPIRLAVLALPAFLGACNSQQPAGAGSGEPAQSGPGARDPAQTNAVIVIDGSSTVYPISEAIAEEFQAANPARVTVGLSGTGGGFQKLCNGEIDVAGASRPIKPTEVEACRTRGVEFVEIPIAFDGIAVIVHPSNTWARTMTVEELARIWQPAAQGTLTRWNQVRPEWPDQDLHLFGAGVDSGTYDYFTKAIVGEEHSSRGDYTSSEDDNVIVQGVATDPGALGFLGLAYYEENRERLGVVAVTDGDESNGSGAIEPSVETVRNATYQPLSRPLFLYVRIGTSNADALDAWVRFALGHGAELSGEVGYVPLPDRAYELATARWQARRTGSVFEGHGSQVGVTIEQLLERE